MRFINYLFYFTLLVSLSLLVSCKDDEEDSGLPRSELLTAGEWQGDRVLLNGINVSNRPEIKGALLDIVTLRLKFDEDGTYQANYADGSGQRQYVEGEWALSEDEKILRFDLFKDNELEIDKLTTSEFDLTSEVEYNNTSWNVEVQLKR
ncbi:hypothetical protein CLV24_10233 [Pontibacter ummariensis]|uniref:Lipocalin-like domain-containing protein n=1 Tax=Pontibacter ummariensis TaxID=1610492 RepID=A0A239C771_9BACT|nr:hypothetical protein [Pontibacter ummariensis]PRY15412.1 hypothetical protein CLV24_10233 [Pontibacter ummariensis]SNS15960.1 hypothetical protein SAMN06296052_102380 [Pontibacter ummariensis]